MIPESQADSGVRCASGVVPGSVLVALLVGLVAAGCSAGPGARSAAELTNPSLSPAHAQWLVGAVARLATPEERREYLALTSDFAAVDFVEAFWRRRDPDPEEPGNPVRETFERRAQEADQKFSEGGISGRRTARGVIHILYGPPERTDYEIPRPGDEPVEVWFYPDDAGIGLDGRRPDGAYRFQRVGGVTRIYRPGSPPTRLERPDGPR